MAQEVYTPRHKWPREKIIFQNYEYDCGYAMFGTGMLMIGREDVLKTDLFNRLKVDPVNGTSPKNIKKVLDEERIGYIETFFSTLDELSRLVHDGYFAFISYQSEGSELEMLNMECGHYSIVFDVDDLYVWMIDPSYDWEWESGFGNGVVRVERGEFEERWKDKEGTGELYLKWMMAFKYKNGIVV